MPTKPAFIFIGSMSDIEYWNYHTLSIVRDVCARNPKHTFLFLSKGVCAYAGIDWPDNTMQGLTMELTQTAHCQAERIEATCYYPHPFLSLEPLCGCLRVGIPAKIERVIVGAMTGPGAIKVRPEWVQSIKDHCPADKLFWKASIW
jgi:protein gp37